VEDRGSQQSLQECSLGLLSRAQKNDILAWSMFVSLFTPLVYTWLRQWGLAPEEAQNVGQVTLLSVHRQLRTYDPRQSGETFRSWLVRLTWHEFEGHRDSKIMNKKSRVLKPEVLTETVVFALETEEETVATESNQLRARALEIIKELFPKRDWDAFQQVVFENQSAVSVARNLGCQPSEVFLAKSKILRKLRQEFDGLIEF